ncbi:hypothetical protein ACLOJK_037773 [Asimina triloba]
MSQLSVAAAWNGFWSQSYILGLRTSNVPDSDQSTGLKILLPTPSAKKHTHCWLPPSWTWKCVQFDLLLSTSSFWSPPGVSAHVQPYCVNLLLVSLFSVQHFCKQLVYKELVLATNNFSDERKLGQGGFGGVFMGYLSGLNLAVANFLPPPSFSMSSSNKRSGILALAVDVARGFVTLFSRS